MRRQAYTRDLPPSMRRAQAAGVAKDG